MIGIDFWFGFNSAGLTLRSFLMMYFHIMIYLSYNESGWDVISYDMISLPDIP